MSPLRIHAPLAAGFLLLASTLVAAPQVTSEHLNPDDTSVAFAFSKIPRPSSTDAATKARFLVLDGDADHNSGYLDKLHDGRFPDEEDQAGENFFFRSQSNGGLLLVDLENAISIRQINTYSWHNGWRAPQVYKVYGADGTAKNFNLLPKKGIPLGECGWTLIASVNTAPASGNPGGQYGVSIADPDGTLGKYRYLLFEISAAKARDAFSETFYSEIDVIDAAAPVVKAEPPPPSAKFEVKTADGRCTITINPDAAPELKDWSHDKLAPVLAEWYPKIVTMLPSEGFTAPEKFKLTLKPTDGVAYTVGTNVVANATWVQANLATNAIGALVHEMVHVVQQLKGYGGTNPAWLVEGMADYIRWFKFEPQTHGADIVWMRKQKKLNARYDGSYRVTANFLNWVIGKYDKDLIAQVNAVMRENKYNDEIWKQRTGKTLQELGDEWKAEVTKQLAAPEPAKQE